MFIFPPPPSSWALRNGVSERNDSCIKCVCWTGSGPMQAQSAVISGIVPLTGSTPRPSEDTNSCRALAMIQKGLVVGLGVMFAASLRRVCTPFGMEDLLAVLGGFVGALRVPEKWVPGRLDLLANSHHIMHVVVVYAVYHLHQGAVLDLVWLSGNSTCPHPTVASPTPTL
ncbi:Progestin and adipoQ receptor family member 4 [Portunus trituberculatus]|uniref:Progestin and adipoQ receptor family member 4 n=1 Tax=Portunus trituberculatus TaxID=210409 RepID=A0A5B7E9K4_PORTR|nr:Progestin and adipoQ receptor family member 4 [Portunus trituberculatus]